MAASIFVVKVQSLENDVRALAGIWLAAASTGGVTPAHNCTGPDLICQRAIMQCRQIKSGCARLC